MPPEVDVRAMTGSEFEEEYDGYLRREEHHDIGATILREPISNLEPRTPVTVGPEDTVERCLELLCKHHIGCVLVVLEDRPIGIFTERDVVKKVTFPARDPKKLLVREVMTPNPECLRADDRVVVALNRMMVGGYRHIPVVDPSGRAVGILSVRNFVRFIVSMYPEAVLNQPPSRELKHPGSVDGG